MQLARPSLKALGVKQINQLRRRVPLEISSRRQKMDEKMDENG